MKSVKLLMLIALFVFGVTHTLWIASLMKLNNSEALWGILWVSSLVAVGVIMGKRIFNTYQVS